MRAKRGDIAQLETAHIWRSGFLAVEEISRAKLSVPFLGVESTMTEG